MKSSKDLETIPEIIAEFDEIMRIYKAILERECNPKIAYLEMLYAHDCGALSRIGLWMPRDFFAISF